MNILLLVIFLLFYSPLVWAEEELKGFVVTPQSAEFALYNYLLSPSSVEVTLACVGTRVVFEEKVGGETHTYVCNFDCDNSSFEWQIISEKPWVRFEPARGEGETLTKIRVSVDKRYLKNVPTDVCNDVPCFKSGVTFRFRYYLDDCVEYSANSTAPASVTYYLKEDFPDFIRVYYSVAGLSPQVTPKEVNFQGELIDGIAEFTPAEVQILAGHQGWDYTFSAPWLSINKIEKTLTEGALQIQPTGLREPGRYRGYIRVRDRATGRISSITITTDVLSTNSSLANFFYALFPDGNYYDRIDVKTAQWFKTKIYLGPSTSNQPLYIEVTHSAFPDYIFAYHWQNGSPTFSVASYKGRTVPDVDYLYYAATGTEEIQVGSFRLANLPGIAHIRLKQGSSWANSKTILDIELVIHSLNGSWKITDTYNDEEYEHPHLLTINENLTTLSAIWGDYNPQIRYSTDPTALYEIFFKAKNFTFRYQINYVTSDYISGFWSYSLDGITFSNPQPFYGIKISQ